MDAVLENRVQKRSQWFVSETNVNAPRGPDRDGKLEGEHWD